jgi:hypothetical protein
MPVALQVKLLRVLQDQKVERLGSNERFAVNVRVPKRTLYDKMRKLGLSTEEFHASDARREAIVNAAAGNRLEAAHDSWRHGPAWAGSGPRPIRAGVPG